jgi:hypothetical protein
MRVVLILSLFVISCTTQKKAVRYFNENEPIASKYCADKYPVKTDTLVIVEHDTTLLKEYIKDIDSIEIHDTICLEYREKIKYIIKNNPPIIKTITIEKENTAKIKSLQFDNDDKLKKIYKLEAKNEILKKRTQNYLIFILFLLLMIIGYIAKKYVI